MCNVYFFCLIYGFTIKSQFSTSSKVVDANQQRLSATWLQQAVFSPVVFLPSSREVKSRLKVLEQILGVQPRCLVSFKSLWIQKGQIIKVNHSIKFTIKLQMQRFIEAVSFASYLYICPFSSGSPPMCGAFDGFGSIPAEKGIWAWQLWQICGVSRENLGYTDTKQDNTTTTCGETTDKIQSVPRANSLIFCEPGC